MTEITSNHQQFIKNLIASQDFVWLVAMQFQAWGHAVRVNPYRVAPSADVHEEYADNGDLEMIYKVEVKHLSRNFTGRDSWPFGDKFIVDGVEKFDKKFPVPEWYVALSDDCRTMATLNVRDTRKDWRIEPRRNQWGNTEQFYFVSTDLVRFVPMTVTR